MHAFCLGRAFCSLVRSSVGTHVYERKINVYIGLVLFEKLISNLTIKLRNTFFSNCSKQFHCHQPRIVLANHKSKKELETVAIFPIKFKKKSIQVYFRADDSTRYIVELKCSRLVCGFFKLLHHFTSLLFRLTLVWRIRMIEIEMKMTKRMSRNYLKCS